MKGPSGIGILFGTQFGARFGMGKSPDGKDADIGMIPYPENLSMDIARFNIPLSSSLSCNERR